MAIRFVEEHGMTDSRAVHILVFDGFADWEPAHALAELRRWGKRAIRTVGFTPAPVLSMGGLRIVPDVALGDVRATDVELFLLPGGDLWESNGYPRSTLEPLVRTLLADGTPVAAICGATVAMGRAGVLDDRRHTSNTREYLAAHAPEYRGSKHYVDMLAVRDDHLITASGLASVDFARAIFAELGIFSAAHEQLWFDMFKYGKLPARGT
jgi:putative intracellular protease/amidase